MQKTFYALQGLIVLSPAVAADSHHAENAFPRRGPSSIRIRACSGFDAQPPGPPLHKFAPQLTLTIALCSFLIWFECATPRYLPGLLRQRSLIN